MDKSLRASIKDAIAWSIMDGAGSAYLSAFAVAIKSSTTQIGLLSSLPTLIGNASQLLGIKLLGKFSRKRTVMTGVLIQALCWLPLALIGILNLQSPWALIFFYTLGVTTATLVGPAWFSWTGDMVQEQERGRFFGIRSALATIASLLTKISAGIFIGAVPATHAFGVLFLIAFFARTWSFFCMNEQDSIPFTPDHTKYFSFTEFIKKSPYNNFGRFTWFITLNNLAAYIAAPYFVPYLLQDLKISYFVLMLITVSEIVSALIFVSIWGKIMDKYGSIRILQVASSITLLRPILWMLSPNIYWILIVQFIGGFVSSGFDLSATKFILDSTTRERRPICVAYYNLLNGIAVFLGSMIGSALIVLEIPLLGKAVFLAFIVSGVLRIVFYGTIATTLKEIKQVEQSPSWFVLVTMPVIGVYEEIRRRTVIKRNN